MTRKRRLTGEAAWDAAFATVDHATLAQTWGVEVPRDLLRLALTHRSFAHENGNLPTNERLEFLGDAVLGLVVAERLYLKFPSRSESAISKMRASVVNMYALADVARELELGPAILLGRGEKTGGGHDKNSILADTMEAMLGAIYLHHGFDTARDTILRIFDEKIANAPAVGLTMDWKTVLAERAAALKLGLPVYQTSVDGPAHEQVFSTVLFIDDEPRGEGSGATKKESEHAAARAAVESLAARP